MTKKRFRYLLGASRREAARLRAQARLWDPVAHALFDRLGVRPGHRVLEIGPGQGSLHLELRRRVGGPVDAVERSPAFAAALRRACRRDGFGEGRLWNTELARAELPAGHYDLIFVRWVFLFLPDPAAHLRQLARALRPGGRLAIQDYHRDSLMLVPRPPEWADFLAADRAFFATEGGDVNIGARLPELCARAGLRVREVRPTVMSGHPGSAVWNWLSEYFLGVLPRYGRLKPFTPVAASRLRRRWLAAARESSSLLIAPCVLDVVSERPRAARGAKRRPERRP